MKIIQNTYVITFVKMLMLILVKTQLICSQVKTAQLSHLVINLLIAESLIGSLQLFIVNTCILNIAILIVLL